MTHGTSGHGSLTESPTCDPDTWYLRTLRPMSVEVSTSWPQTLPRSGMTSRGRMSELPTLSSILYAYGCSNLHAPPTSTLGTHVDYQLKNNMQARLLGYTLADA